MDLFNALSNIYDFENNFHKTYYVCKNAKHI